MKKQLKYGGFHRYLAISDFLSASHSDINQSYKVKISQTGAPQSVLGGVMNIHIYALYYISCKDGGTLIDE